MVEEAGVGLGICANARRRKGSGVSCRQEALVAGRKDDGQLGSRVLRVASKASIAVLLSSSSLLFCRGWTIWRCIREARMLMLTELCP